MIKNILHFTSLSDQVQNFKRKKMMKTVCILISSVVLLNGIMCFPQCGSQCADLQDASAAQSGMETIHIVTITRSYGVFGPGIYLPGFYYGSCEPQTNAPETTPITNPIDTVTSESTPPITTPEPTTISVFPTTTSTFPTTTTPSGIVSAPQFSIFIDQLFQSLDAGAETTTPTLTTKEELINNLPPYDLQRVLVDLYQNFLLNFVPVTNSP